MLATEVIKNKRSRLPLSKAEIEFFIMGYTKGDIPDYQMASLLMAIFLNGMETDELVHLTQTMIQSGEHIQFFDMSPVDKHSTGGVGDKTSLILAPIVAACGVPVPMMSGRGLGHTGGTLDKLESIPGFNVNLDLESFKEQVKKAGLSFIGQTENICPADKKIYSLRDVTGTVESLPLICASIMSKKIAEGIKGLVLDVKMGSGAFMKNIADSRALAAGLRQLAEANGITFQAIISNMNQPLGRFVGNALEVGECFSVLQRQDFRGYCYTEFSDTEELSIELSARMISIGLDVGIDEGRQRAREVLNNGKAWEKFEEVCKLQGGDASKLESPHNKVDVLAREDGFLEFINGEEVGIAGISIGAGRKKITDKINPLTGIEVHKKIGDSVSKGEAIFSVHSDKKALGVEQATLRLSACFTISKQTQEKLPLIIEQA